MVEDDLKPRYCLSCNYDLRASSDRCPECGRSFDPANSRSFSPYPRRVRLRRWIFKITLVISSIALILSASIMVLWRGWRLEQNALQSMRAYVDVNYARSILPSPVARLFGDRFAYVTQRTDEISVRLSNVANADLSATEALTHLRKISIVGGRIREADLVHLSKLQSLQTLDIVFAEVSDDYFAVLSKFPSLEELDLRFNKNLTESCLVLISASPNLQILRLGGMRIGGAGGAQLKKLTRLRELELTGSELDDQAIDQIRDMTQLEILKLYYSGAPQANLARLLPLKTLRSFSLDQTIDSQWVDGLKRLPSLKTLEIVYWDPPTWVESQWLQAQLPNVQITYRDRGGGTRGPARIRPIMLPTSQLGPPN